jgi:hypothetical protein
VDLLNYALSILLSLVIGLAGFVIAFKIKGTNISEFNPFWQGKICGFRKIPARQ